jgi:VanZ family protein
MTRTTLRRTLLAVYVLAVTFLMVAPIRAPQLAAEIPESDKLVHVGVFGLMTGLIWWNLEGRQRGRIFWAAVLATGFAVLVECVQSFVPYRSADPLDAAAGLAGALACAVVLARALRDGRPE